MSVVIYYHTNSQPYKLIIFHQLNSLTMKLLKYHQIAVIVWSMENIWIRYVLIVRLSCVRLYNCPSLCDLDNLYSLNKADIFYHHLVVKLCNVLTDTFL